MDNALPKFDITEADQLAESAKPRCFSRRIDLRIIHNLNVLSVADILESSAVSATAQSNIAEAESYFAESFVSRACASCLRLDTFRDACVGVIVPASVD